MKKTLFGIFLVGLAYMCIYLTLLIMEITFGVFNTWATVFMDIFLLVCVVFIVDGLVKFLQKKHDDDD
jgi:hypothetical protein